MNYMLIGGVRGVGQSGVLPNSIDRVGRVVLAHKTQPLKPSPKQVEKDAIEAAKAFMADYEADLRELAKL